MKKPLDLKISESLSDLKILWKKQHTIIKQKRIDCLIHIKTSKFKTRQELANHLGIHIRTQERWLTKYRDGGISFFITDLPNNRPSKIITKEIHDALEFRVTSSNTPFSGYWEVQQWLKEEFDVDIKYHWIREYLITHFKTKLKSPRKLDKKKEVENDLFFCLAPLTPRTRGKLQAIL